MPMVQELSSPILPRPPRWAEFLERMSLSPRLRATSATAFQDVVIDINQAASIADSIPADNFPNPIPDHVLHPDANGWVRVDQPALDNGFYGSLFYLNTNTIIDFE